MIKVYLILFFFYCSGILSGILINQTFDIGSIIPPAIQKSM